MPEEPRGGAAYDTSAPRPARQRLTRERVLQAALDFVDAHGLAALGMNRLGAELGVKGMSLYSHVAGKEGLLDGIVQAMWEDVRIPDTSGMEWPEAVRSYAFSMRGLVARHPQAAPLLTRSVMPDRALEELDAYRQALMRAGFTADQSVRALRAVCVYARGYALAELSWGALGEQRSPVEDDLSRLRRVSALLHRDTPDRLLRLALDFCGTCSDAQFEHGLDLIMCGLCSSKE